MNTKPQQVYHLFSESGYCPTELNDDWIMSVAIPMTDGGEVTISVGWDQGPDTVWAGETELPFTSFDDFAAFFRAILKGCIKGDLA